MTERERLPDFYAQRLTLETRGVAPVESLARLLERHALAAGWRTSTPPADAWERTLRRYYAEVYTVLSSAVIETALEPAPYWACLARLRIDGRKGAHPPSVYARALADLAVLNLGWPRAPFYADVARPVGETPEERRERRAELMP